MASAGATLAWVCEKMMLKALILVCSIASAECTESTALSVIRVPETFQSAVACLMRAQAYAAQTAELTKDMQVKIFCYPNFKQARR